MKMTALEKVLALVDIVIWTIVILQLVKAW